MSDQPASAGPFKALWDSAICLGSPFMGGIVGNIAASLAWEVGKYAAKPLLSKVPEIAELLRLGGTSKNHDLLRALRRAESAAMVEIINSCILEHSNIRMDTRSAREFLQARWLSRNDPTLDALCRLRRTFSNLFWALKSMSVEGLIKLNSGALSDLPGLVNAGSECFRTDESEHFRMKVVNDHIAWLSDAVTAPARFVGLAEDELAAVLPQGLPDILVEHLRRHPQGWCDFLRVAFREELKNPENGRARIAWDLDVQSRLKAQLGESYEVMVTRLNGIDHALDQQWALLQSLRDDFDRFAQEVLVLVRNIDEGVTRVEAGVEAVSVKLDHIIANQLDSGHVNERGAAWHQLPSLPEHFFGRDGTIATIAAAVRDAYAHGDRSKLVRVIEGAGGLGKSALAMAIGHALRSDFPDLQFVLPLGAHSGRPVSAEQARDTLLLKLYPGTSLPDDEELRWASYQNLFKRPDGSAMRCLLIIDNCASDTQLRRLLPAVDCPVIVTTRRALATGVSEEITGLDPASAIQVLAGIYPVLADDNLAAELVRLCGYFPIALRAAAACLRHGKRRGNAIRTFLAELRADLLGRLESNDVEANPRAVLEYSLRELQSSDLKVLQALTVFSSDFDRAAALAVAACTENSLDLLTELHLIEVMADDGRLVWHDLLRMMAKRGLSAIERDAARSRFVAHYAEVCRDAGAPYRDGRGDFVGGQRRVIQELEHIQSAIAWLTAGDFGPVDLCAWLRALHPGMVRNRIALPVLEAFYRSGIQAAQTLDDPEGRALALSALAYIVYWRNQFATARGHYEAALAIDRDIGNRAGEANALYGLGEVASMFGDNPAARGHFEAALAIHRDIGNRAGEAYALSGLGEVARMLGDNPAARGHFEAVLAIHRDIGNRAGEAYALYGLGEVVRMLGDPPAARGHFEAALAIHRDIGNRAGKAYALGGLGEVARMLDDNPAARGHYEAALAIHRDIGNRAGEAYALGGLGDVAYMLGDNPAARGHYEAALAIHRDIGNRAGEAHALGGLGDVARMLGDHPAARGHSEAALAIHRAIGNRAGEADELFGLGAVAYDLNDHPAARGHFEAAQAIYRDIGNRYGEANAVFGLGQVARMLNDHSTARGHYEAALVIFRDIGNRSGEANALEGLGEAARMLGDNPTARGHFEAALAIFRDISNSTGEANALIRLSLMTRR